IESSQWPAESELLVHRLDPSNPISASYSELSGAGGKARVVVHGIIRHHLQRLWASKLLQPRRQPRQEQPQSPHGGSCQPRREVDSDNSASPPRFLFSHTIPVAS